MDGSDHSHVSVQHISPGPYPSSIPHGLGAHALVSLTDFMYRKAKKSTACVKCKAAVFK